MLLSCGCFRVRYLSQAVHGQLDLLSRRQPIDKILRNPQTPPKLRDFLQESQFMRTYASEHGLKVTDNYTTYAQLERNAAVWVVTASPPLTLQAKSWHFVIGGFTYIGWFNQTDANRFAETLRSQGLDVHVRGATAYSTLGWFDDPLLSTMISREPYTYGDLANLIFHESTHATVYIDNQSFFNESLANFVADTLGEIYVRERFGEKSRAARAYQAQLTRSHQHNARMNIAYQALIALYDSAMSDADKLRQKAVIYEKLRVDLGHRARLNNAAMVGFHTYGAGQLDFSRLYEACGKDFRRFFAQLVQVRRKSFDRHQQEKFLDTLAPQVAACAANPLQLQ
ncbi:MAG: aminopeptidase [Myxococcota bacterium]